MICHMTHDIGIDMYAMEHCPFSSMIYGVYMILMMMMMMKKKKVMMMMMKKKVMMMMMNLIYTLFPIKHRQGLFAKQ